MSRALANLPVEWIIMSAVTAGILVCLAMFAFCGVVAGVVVKLVAYADRHGL